MIAVRRFVTLALLAGLSWGLEAAYGQMRTYFEDACAEGLSGMYWNLEESTQIEAAGAPYYMLSVNGHEAMPAWASDPDGELFYRMSFGERIPVATTPLEGTYVLRTVPFRLAEGEVRHRFALEYVYQATDESRAKSFGLMVREPGMEWDTVSRLYSLGDAIEPETEGTFSVNLPDAYGGKEVELALFCSNLDTVPFAFAFRNVSFEAWNGKALLVAGVCERVVSEGGSLGLDLVFRNGGLEGLASAEMSWMVNSSALRKISVDEAIGSGEETDASLELAAEDLLLDQANVLKVWNSEPLVEIFTSATCGPCRAMNRALLPVFEQLKMGDSLNILKYQVNIPQPDKYYIPVNGERADYYGVNSAPAPFYNGTVSMKDWYDEAWTEAEGACGSVLEGKSHDSHRLCQGGIGQCGGNFGHRSELVVLCRYPGQCDRGGVRRHDYREQGIQRGDFFPLGQYGHACRSDGGGDRFQGRGAGGIVLPCRYVGNQCGELC